jgi:hypothetical protein
MEIFFIARFNVDTMMSVHIAPDTPLEEMTRLAMALHNAIGRMPIVIKARDRAGVLVEDGLAHEAVHEGEALDRVFSGDGVKQVKVNDGKHAGVTMFASAIVNAVGQRVAAIGVIDTLGLLSLEEFVVTNDHLDKQLYGPR